MSGNQGQSQEVKSQPTGGMDTGLGGFSFETSAPPKQPVSNDPFGGLMGLDLGGQTNQPSTQPPQNTGFGGDLLGFG